MCFIDSKYKYNYATNYYTQNKLIKIILRYGSLNLEKNYI